MDLGRGLCESFRTLMPGTSNYLGATPAGRRTVRPEEDSVNTLSWLACYPNNEITEPNRPMLGTPQHVATQLRAYMDAGFDTALVELPAPYDHQTIERLMLEVKPLVEAP